MRSSLRPFAVASAAASAFTRDGALSDRRFADLLRALSENLPAGDRSGTEAGLHILLCAARDEATLSPFGATALRWDILRLIKNLGRFREEESRMPALLSERIDKPLIITGMPRSGTTFLQSILAEDPGNQVLRCWQALQPCSDPKRSLADRLRRLGADTQLRIFRLIAPELDRLHPVRVNSPQECTDVTAHIFQSLRFDTIYHVPSYRAWLDGQGHVSAYRFHKRFLQHLQHRHGRRRWVLKSPDHVFAMDALCHVYPDARLVFVHRAPERTIPSVARLTEILRASFSTRIDRLQIGRQIMADWSRGAKAMIDWSRDGRQAPASIHIQYQALARHPFETIQGIYAHFGMTIDKTAGLRMRRAIAAHRSNNIYRHGAYHPGDYGIDTRMICDVFGDYTQHFDIPAERAENVSP